MTTPLSSVGVPCEYGSIPKETRLPKSCIQARPDCAFELSASYYYGRCFTTASPVEDAGPRQVAQVHAHMTKFLQPQIRRHDERARHRRSRTHIANALMPFQQTGHIVSVNIFKCLDADPRGSTGPHQSSAWSLARGSRSNHIRTFPPRVLITTSLTTIIRVFPLLHLVNDGTCSFHRRSPRGFTLEIAGWRLVESETNM